MFRFFFFTIVLLAIGAGILSIFSDTLVSEFVFFVFCLLTIAAVLKVLLDFVLHYRQEEEESLELLEEPEGKTFYDLKEFVKAVRERDKKER